MLFTYRSTDILNNHADLTPDMESMFCPRCHCFYMPGKANLRIISRKKMKKLQQNKTAKISIVPCVKADGAKTRNYIVRIAKST